MHPDEILIAKADMQMDVLREVLERGLEDFRAIRAQFLAWARAPARVARGDARGDD